MGIFQDNPTFDDFLAEVNAYQNAITSGRLRQRSIAQRAIYDCIHFSYRVLEISPNLVTTTAAKFREYIG
jgi:hypothetical protein